MRDGLSEGARALSESVLHQRNAMLRVTLLARDSARPFLLCPSHTLSLPISGPKESTDAVALLVSD